MTIISAVQTIHVGVLGLTTSVALQEYFLIALSQPRTEVESSSSDEEGEVEADQELEHSWTAQQRACIASPWCSSRTKNKSVKRSPSTSAAPSAFRYAAVRLILLSNLGCCLSSTSSCWLWCLRCLFGRLAVKCCVLS